MNQDNRSKALLLGLGLDGDDGHVRITRGEDFHLLGGSQRTHERMQETAIRIHEKLADRGRRLGEVSREEFLEIARDIGLKGP